MNRAMDAELLDARAEEAAAPGVAADVGARIGAGAVDLVLVFVIGAVLSLAPLVFGGFGVWAAVAPLDRAAVATGQVAVSGDHKVVQHLEGGIVREILVKETQQVKQGDVLFRLQPTEAQANTDILRKQMDALLAEEARIVAEQSNVASITFPDSVLARRDVPETAQAIAGHDALDVGVVFELLDDPAALQEARDGAERARRELTWEAAARAHIEGHEELL